MGKSSIQRKGAAVGLCVVGKAAGLIKMSKSSLIVLAVFFTLSAWPASGQRKLAVHLAFRFTAAS